MTISKFEAAAFKVKAVKHYSPYSSTALTTHIGQFLLFFISFYKPVANVAVASVCQFLKAYIPYFFITSISIKCVLAVFLRRGNNGGF